MSRDHLTILGAIAWSIVALDFAVHLIVGDVVVPIFMVAMMVAWSALRWYPARRAVRA